VPINSASATELFAVTNLVAGGNSITVATPAVSGDFSVSNAVSGGVPCGGALAYTASCFVQIDSRPRQPAAHGNAQHAGGSSTASAAHRYGSTDPGLALTPMRWSSTTSRQLVHAADGHAAQHQHERRAGWHSLCDDDKPSATSSAQQQLRNAQRRRTCAISVTFTPATASRLERSRFRHQHGGGAPVLTNYRFADGAIPPRTKVEIVADDAEYGRRRPARSACRGSSPSTT